MPLKQDQLLNLDIFLISKKWRIAIPNEVVGFILYVQFNIKLMLKQQNSRFNGTNLLLLSDIYSKTVIDMVYCRKLSALHQIGGAI
jgi:hypothetical protein